MALVIPGHTNPRPQEVTLEEIRDILGNCDRCELAGGRNNIVFGSGNPNARVVIIGEAPGKNEDMTGDVFVGSAGKKLDSLLDIANLTRNDVYICNVLKCRLPSNRNPHVSEVDACAPYLREQIRSVWPDVIVCLGNFASRFILNTEAGVSNLRGQFYKTGHFDVLVTFHPAASVYRKEWQEYLEDDFALLGQYLKDNPSKKEL